MNQDLSIIALVLHASLVVQLVMALLLIVSLASWTVIFGKVIGLRRVKADNDEFDQEFWAGRTLQELYQDAQRGEGPVSPQERIFAAGMRGFMKLRERRVADVASLLDGSRRA
ncbi:MAG: protein TolQ, partial [Aquabacterium sp.]|nr:protein TolQ [Aquabacterium sp.]